MQHGKPCRWRDRCQHQAAVLRAMGMPTKTRRRHAGESTDGEVDRLGEGSGRWLALDPDGPMKFSQLTKRKSIGAYSEIRDHIGATEEARA